MFGQGRYGPLKDIVTAAGMIIAAGGAITLAFRGRANWEPSEQDIPAGPQKVAALITAVLIVVVWATMSHTAFRGNLIRLAKWMAIGSLCFLLLYSFVTATQTYSQVMSTAPDQYQTERIIGGFWLTPEAKDAQLKNRLTIQEMLKGAGYDPDIIWSRPSRALAKLCFVVCYVGLIVCGSLALATAAIILGLGPALPPTRSSPQRWP